MRGGHGAGQAPFTCWPPRSHSPTHVRAGARCTRGGGCCHGSSWLERGRDGPEVTVTFTTRLQPDQPPASASPARDGQPDAAARGLAPSQRSGHPRDAMGDGAALLCSTSQSRHSWKRSWCCTHSPWPWGFSPCLHPARSQPPGCCSTLSAHFTER